MKAKNIKTLFVAFFLLFFSYSCHAQIVESSIYSISGDETLILAKIPNLSDGNVAIVDIKMKYGNSEIFISKKEIRPYNLNKEKEIYLRIQGIYPKDIFEPIVLSVIKTDVTGPRAYIEKICQNGNSADVLITFKGYELQREKVKTRILYRNRTKNELAWKQSGFLMLDKPIQKDNACDPKSNNQVAIYISNLENGSVYQMRPVASVEGDGIPINYETVKISGKEYLANGTIAPFRSILVEFPKNRIDTPHYLQCGNVWSDYVFYHGENFCKDGCLDTSMSMILAYWYNKDPGFRANWDSKLSDIYNKSTNEQKKFIKLSEGVTGKVPNPFSSYAMAKINGYWWSSSIWDYIGLKPIRVKSNDPKYIENNFISKGIPLLIYCTPSHASGRSNHFAVDLGFSKYENFSWNNKKYINYAITNDSYYGYNRILDVVYDYNYVKSHKNPNISRVPTCGYQHGISTTNQFFGGLVAFVPKDYYFEN